MSKKLENAYKTGLSKRIKELLPGCEVFHLDPNETQGAPDLLILGTNGRWATLEGKRNSKAPYRPNQEYYIAKHNRMAFSRMICPENEKEVLDELQRSLGS